MPRIAACGAPADGLRVGHALTPSGCRRMSGWPGETRSPSSTSHSTIVPPYGAVDRGLVLRGPARRRSGAPGAMRAALGQVGGLVEGALGGRDQHPPGRVGVEVRAAAVLLDERAGVVELVGGLQRERLDALHGPPGDAGQGAGGRHLEHPGDAEVEHRLHAEVPADRRADLGDDPLEHLAAVVHDLAVAVGDQRDARVVGRHRAGQAGEHVDRGRHVLGVERAGHRQRHQPGLGRAGPRRTPRAARRCRPRRSGRGRCRWRR